MSLDVYLTRKKWVSYDKITYTEESEDIYSANITHNLNEMAERAGIYNALWRPYRLKKDYVANNNYKAECEFEEKQIIKAGEIVQILQNGLTNLRLRPEYFKKFNSPNGWGRYENFVSFVENYLAACKKYPTAIINVSR